ncbi:MAG: hypothetical protein ACKPBB_15810 [Sphaerospermopsis kisseleviana]
MIYQGFRFIQQTLIRLFIFPVTSHQSPVTSHQSPVTSPQSPVTSPQSPVTSPQSPVPSPQFPVTNTMDNGNEYRPWYK